MKINTIRINSLHYKGILLAIILPLVSITIMAQEPLYGPQDTPPKESSITFTGTVNDGLIGRAAGKVYTITNVTLANSTKTYWTIMSESVKLSMDGAEYSGAENMSIDVGQSNLAGGVLVWTGATRIITYDYGTTYTNLNSKFIVTVTNGSGAPVSLTDPSLTGLEAQSGGAVLISGNEMTLNIRMQMLVSDNATTWTPHLDYYDSKHTMGTNAYSSYNYGFYWENDPPVLENLLAATVDEGDTVVIASLNLSASDLESPDSSIIFIANPRATDTLPDFGSFYMEELAVTYPDTFSLRDITDGNLSYIHDGSESEKDSIALMLKDGDGAIYKDDMGDSIFYLALTVTPIDDSPIVTTNDGATVDEDAELVLSEGLLLTEDPESGPELVSYTLDPEINSDYPMNGTLFLSDVPMSDGTTFTQADINSGAVKYEHDGSATLSDGFTFSVADEFGHPAMNGESSTFFFSITINPINDLPHLTKLYPLEIKKGETGHITNELLAAADEESDDANIIFTIDPDFVVDNPVDGTVMLGDVSLGDGGTFTMEDVNNNLVSYVHNGANNASDFFVFKVSDHEGGIAKDGDYTDFHFNITLTNVSIEDNSDPIDEIQLYPNPCIDYLNVIVPSEIDEDTELSIMNILGKTVITEHFSSEAGIMINMEEQADGLYFITIKNNNINKCLKLYKKQ